MSSRFLGTLLFGLVIFAAYCAIAFFESNFQSSESASLREKTEKRAAIASLSLPVRRVVEKKEIERAVIVEDDAHEGLPAEEALRIANEFMLSERGIQIAPHHQLKAELNRTPLSTHITYHVYDNGYKVDGIEINLTVQQGKVDQVVNQYRPVRPADFENIGTVEDAARKLEEHRSFVVDEEGKVGTVVIAGDSDVADVAYVIPAYKADDESVKLQLTVRARDGQILRRSQSRSEF